MTPASNRNGPNVIKRIALSVIGVVAATTLTACQSDPTDDSIPCKTWLNWNHTDQTETADFWLKVAKVKVTDISEAAAWGLIKDACQRDPSGDAAKVAKSVAESGN